jgi:hypothetical protein
LAGCSRFAAESARSLDIVLSLSRRELLIGGLLMMDPARPASASQESETFTVLRLPFNASRPNALWETPEVVRIIANAPATLEALIAALTAASAESAAQFHDPLALSAVGVGPVLDSPDKVRLRDFVRSDGRLVLRIDYTRIRMMDVTLPRSLPWRPILVAAVPAGLTPGRYEVEAVWRALSAIPDGPPLPVADLREAAHFEIVG